MTAWHLGAVDAEPHIVLTDWAVMQVVTPSPTTSITTRHFVGICTGKPPRAQVSSPVLVFDPATARGMTESGRIYQLNGFSPIPANVLATWNRWKELHRTGDHVNVSSEVVREIFAATGAFGRRN